MLEVSMDIPRTGRMEISTYTKKLILKFIVARDIARHRLIPFYKFFGKSSEYGTAEWDGFGTPTGGLILHAVITCIYIASIPLRENNASQQFVLRLYTYGHSVVSCKEPYLMAILVFRADTDIHTKLSWELESSSYRGECTSTRQELQTFQMIKTMPNGPTKC